MSEPLHPRPQLTRARWVDLSGPWGFAHDDGDIGIADRWFELAKPFTRTIQVPFPPESPASGIGDTGYHPIVWYRRAFAVPALEPGGRLILHCGAVDYRARVWINGRHVAEHEGGHTPFSADITAAVQAGEEAVVVIRAEDPPTDLAQPRGKQDWRPEPHDIWYHRTTGIWQPVWLEPLPAAFIDQVRWTPNVERMALALSLTVRGTVDRPLSLRVELSLDGRPLVDDRCRIHGGALRRELALAERANVEAEQLLWSPEHPNLIEARLTLLDGEEPIDVVQSYAGLRSVEVRDGRFRLNGRPYYLRMALEQGYWPESRLAAPSEAAMRREVELARELGFNGLRLHQKVEDPRFLYWCDRLGLLVWGEMANAYVYSPRAVTRLVREWLEVVERQYNHPCIVAWVPLNESWGVPDLPADPAQRHYVEALYHLTKALDPTRPVIGNDGWEQVAFDILGIHDYSFSGAELHRRYDSPAAIARTIAEVQPGRRPVLLDGARHAGQPVMITEFGGIGYRPEAGEEWFGYGTVGSPEAYLAKYRELVEAILACPGVAGFCYTQLTDTRQETNGLLTEQRLPKHDTAAIRAVTQAPAASLPGELIVQTQHNRGDVPEEPIDVAPA